MKRVLILSLLVSVVVFWGCKSELKIYRIGAVLPLSGEAEAYGQVVKNGLALALNEINDAGGIKGKPLDILFEDDGSAEKKAVDRANGLIQSTKVPLIIGGVTSNEALALVPACEAAQVVLLSPSASSPKLTGVSQFFFRVYPSDTIEAPVMADHAVRKMKVRTVAILYVDKEYGQGLNAEFKKRFTALGGVILLEQAYAEGTTDFSEIIKAIKANPPDAVYLPGYYTEIAAIVKEIAAQDLQVKIISSGGMASLRIAEMAGEAMEGVVFPMPYDPKSQEPANQRFVATFKKKHISEPDVYAAYAYDTLRIVAKAIESCARYPQDLRARLADISGFRGVTGEISFDSNGDVAVTPRLFEVKGGQFVRVQ